MKKYILCFLLGALLFSCSDKDPIIEPRNIDKIEDCVVEAFYCKMLVNGECWVSQENRFHSNEANIDFSIHTIQELHEFLFFTIPLDLPENIQKQFHPRSSDRSLSRPLFTYSEGDGAVITYSINDDIPSERNFFVLTSISPDKRVYEGNFQCVLNKDFETEIFDAPAELVITDGQFRVELSE